MFCEKCGNRLEDDAQFCVKCGAKVVPDVTRATPTNPVYHGTAPAAGAAAGSGVPKTGIIVGAIIVLAAIVVAVILATGVLTPDKPSNQSGSTTIQSTNTPAASNGTTTTDTTDTQSSAEQQAIKDAQAAGKVVLSGTLKFQTCAEVIDQRGDVDSRVARDFRNDTTPRLVFWLDSPQTFTVKTGDGRDTRSQTVRNILIGEGNTGLCGIDNYVNQHVTLAFDSMNSYMFGDITGALFSISIAAKYVDLLSPLHLNSSSTSSSTPSRGDYILPDVATRVYSESELRALSVDELWYARNEIYARHGRLFNNSTLQAYFNSKSWYHGTVAPDKFDASVLNGTELANLNAIVAIEESINSPHRA